METTDEKHAIAILGREKVVTVGEVVHAWERKPSQSQVMQFPRRTLRECAEENKEEADWRVVYVFGISLREQREIRGTDDCRQPCFKENDWWLRGSEGFWTGKQGKSGYHLLDFHLQFTDMSWRGQERDIAAYLGNQYERAHERTVAEAVLSIFMTSRECLLKGSYHWGCSSTANDSLVTVGGFESRGLSVYAEKRSDSFPNIGVVVARKP